MTSITLEQLADIGRITIDWGAADAQLSKTVCDFHGYMAGSPPYKKVNGENMLPKSERLRQTVEYLQNERLSKYLFEIRYVVSTYGLEKAALERGFVSTSIEYKIAEHDFRVFNLWAEVLPNLVSWAFYLKQCVLALQDEIVKPNTSEIPLPVRPPHIIRKASLY